MTQDLPQSMRVISARLGGDAHSLLLETRPVPRPGPGQVLIRVAAAGLNRGDILQRDRSYPAPPGTEYDVLGLEVSGWVAETGDGVTGLTAGAPVCALLKEGGYGEYVLADATLVLPVPEGVAVVDAAALPETFFTVWANLFQRGGLHTGQTVLIHGGSSGIGVTAIQLARAFGARVLCTAGSPAKCDACLRLGADAAINYRDRDFVAEVMAETGGQGVDLILDMVAGSYLQRNLDALALEGTVVMIGLMEGMETAFNIGKLLTRRLTITGSTLWARTPAQKAAIGAELRTEVWPLFAQGRLQPVVQARYPLDRAADAHIALQQGDHIGKLLLTMGAE
ncbi:NAD(P)H-quinone oxidoreductase [Actibacterium mucosum KCTC 23349]|uniref:NAD(P)H-quinone oxidoreductase n=1 Tax=Actibacterium mucosum KCTC 23349 TaxID=1454373 RepID=A0A037ZFT0_9RHOB|nr:NAD(P)H-quinone oxidoreductase [Actibacterium mucosum]KAJ54381.1 NAD(P)H-quinone oxidoreductase [Actibacterium mucosum KCTC 23349]